MKLPRPVKVFWHKLTSGRRHRQEFAHMSPREKIRHLRNKLTYTSGTEADSIRRQIEKIKKKNKP